MQEKAQSILSIGTRNKQQSFLMVFGYNFVNSSAIMQSGRYRYFPTYLCGHNNPIIGFRAVLKLLSRRIYLRAPPPVGHTKRSQASSIGSFQPSTSYTTADCNGNRQVLLDTKSCAALFSRTLSRQLHQCFTVSMPQRHKKLMSAM